MTKTELAAALNISTSMVSRLAKRGMPTDTPERAERWRKRHLEPGRIKGSRFDPKQKARTPATTVATSNPAAAALPAELLAEVETAGAELDKTLTEGNQEWAAVMVQQARELLRKLPANARPRLSLRAWLAMVEWLIHPECEILHAPDKGTLLTPVQFGMRWQGWPDYPLLNEHTLDAACDWHDISVTGWPQYPDDQS